MIAGRKPLSFHRSDFFKKNMWQKLSLTQLFFNIFTLTQKGGEPKNVIIWMNFTRSEKAKSWDNDEQATGENESTVKKFVYNAFLLLKNIFSLLSVTRQFDLQKIVFVWHLASDSYYVCIKTMLSVITSVQWYWECLGELKEHNPCTHNFFTKPNRSLNENIPG